MEEADLGDELFHAKSNLPSLRRFTAPLPEVPPSRRSFSRSNFKFVFSVNLLGFEHSTKPKELGISPELYKFPKVRNALVTRHCFRFEIFE